MSDHGFSVCGVYAIYSARLVGVMIDDTLPAVSWLHAFDRCGTRWLEKYSPPPPWPQYWAEFMETNHFVAWRKHGAQIAWWWEHMCRKVIVFGECAYGGERE